MNNEITEILEKNEITAKRYYSFMFLGFLLGIAVGFIIKMVF